MVKEKNISFLINSLYSGGAEKVLSVLSNKLVEKNYKVTIYSIQNECFYFLNNKIKVINLTNLTVNSNIFIFAFKYIFSFFSFFYYSLKSKDKILISALDLSNILSLIIWKLFLRRKLYIWVHIDPLSQYEKGLYGFFFKNFINFFYNYADKIITVSNESRLILLKNFNINSNKLITIYNPFDIEENLKISKIPIEKSDEKYFNDSFVFINVGRLSKQKAQWRLIRSFKLVVEKNSNAKLLIFGNGELKDKLNKLIKNLNLEENVFLMGVKKNIFSYLARSDCFVLSSLWEGLPTVLIESLNLSKPIITTNCKTGPLEILDLKVKNFDLKINYPYFAKYGILVEPFDTEDIFDSLEVTKLNNVESNMSNIMIKIMEDSSLVDRYSKGLMRAKSFETCNIIKQWEDLF
jgi:glycosyltransferase involved in cell wall biosynthesis